MTLTAVYPHDKDRLCEYCDSPNVRIIDNDGYAPNELICEEHFSHDEISWDDLPLPTWPKKE